MASSTADLLRANPREEAQHPGRFVVFIGRSWELLKDLGHVCWPMRFSLVVTAAAALLFQLPQSQDALHALIEDDPSPVRLVVFAATAFAWAFQTFYWARFMSVLATAPDGHRYLPAWLQARALAWLNLWLPRLLGASVIVTVTGSIIEANPGWRGWLLVFGLAMMAAYLALVVTRRRLIEKVLRQPLSAPIKAQDPSAVRTAFGLGPAAKTGVAAVLALTLAVYGLSAYTPLESPTRLAVALGLLWLATALVCTRLTHSFAWLTKLMIAMNLVLATILFVLSIVSPVTTGRWLGSATIIMIVAGAWVFGATFFLAYPARRLRLPVTALVLLAAFLASAVGHRDNHAIRTLPESIPDGRPDLAAAFDAWWPVASRKWAEAHDGPVPLVLVATAGGASRAAFWTAKVLSEFEQANPDFHNYVFAISSVSGGTLGAGVWRAMLNDMPGRDAAPDQALAVCTDDYEVLGDLPSCARAMIKRDFLSPLFLAGLYPDLTQRLLPGGLLPDRASAIEQAWEVTWAKTFPKAPNRFEEPFHALWAEPGGWRPVLLINGTSVKSGRRIITSNIRLGDDFADAIDFFERTGREVRLSTAIHNSARFPILDAAGTVANGEGASLDLDVDGGYFENFGATTASDAMERLRRIAHERGRSIHFVVIQISSDPELATESGRNEAWSKEVSRGVRVGSDVSAPAITFWQTRDGLGFQATEALRRRVEAFGTASYAHFRLRDDKEPMSWFLSNVAVCRLNREWAANAREVETVDRVLRPAVWAAGAPATPVPQPCAGDEPGAAGVRR